jgi:hypothetical protein
MESTPWTYIDRFSALQLQMPDQTFSESLFLFKHPLPTSLRTQLSNRGARARKSIPVMYQLAREWANERLANTSRKSSKSRSYKQSLKLTPSVTAR